MAKKKEGGKKTKTRVRKRGMREDARELRALADASPVVRAIRADVLPLTAVRLVCNCSRAILKGTVDLASSQREALRPYRKDLRKLASPDTTLEAKRGILKKRKGVLHALVQP